MDLQALLNAKQTLILETLQVVEGRQQYAATYFSDPDGDLLILYQADPNFSQVTQFFMRTYILGYIFDTYQPIEPQIQAYLNEPSPPGPGPLCR